MDRKKPTQKQLDALDKGREKWNKKRKRNKRNKEKLKKLREKK